MFRLFGVNENFVHCLQVQFDLFVGVFPVHQQFPSLILIVKFGPTCITFIQVLPCLVLCAAYRVSSALPLFLRVGLVLPLFLLAWPHCV